MKSLTDSVVVAFNFKPGGTTVCVVGRQKKGVMDIINAFEGQEARDIYDLLTVKKEEGKKDE